MLSLHGVLLDITGKGVLITGKPGCGKSETALTLITRGHRLIADDAPILTRQQTQLVGRADPHQKGLLCVRPLGLIDVVQLFGENAVQDQVVLDLIIHLTTTVQNDPLPTLKIKLVDKIIDNQAIPSLTLPIACQHNMAILIETAVKLAFMPQSKIIERVLSTLE